MQHPHRTLRVVHKQKDTEISLLEQHYFTSLLCEELTHIITLLEKEISKDKEQSLEKQRG